MFHWFSTIRNKWGSPLANWQIELRNPVDDSVVSIFSDSSSTPIATVSGIADRALSDDNGNYGFFVANGTYDLAFYNASGVFQQRVEDVAMYGSEVRDLADGDDLAPAVAFADAPEVGFYRTGNRIVFAMGGGNKRLWLGQSNPHVIVGSTDLVDPTAAFAVQSTTGGVLFPRMTTTQRNNMSGPSDGLVIYNSTTSKLQVRAGGAWVDLH